jgi:hypothetical protein
MTPLRDFMFTPDEASTFYLKLLSGCDRSRFNAIRYINAVK